MQRLALAISITAKAFENKLDKGGKPYILHCLRVMNDTEGDEDVKCAAMMHDLVEDTDEKSPINYTFEKLTELGFTEWTVNTIRLLTHDPSVSYEDYIKLISFSSGATKIKRADLRDNSNITRLKGFRKKDFDRLEKYHRAYVYLSK